MPKFPKNKDYKMKGSEFYQSGNSPAKQVGDKQLVKGQKDLNDIELKHRQPGWAKVASAVANTNIGKGLASMGKKAIKGALMKTKAGQFLEKARQEGKSLEGGNNTSSLEVNEKLMKKSPKLEMGSMGADGLGGS